MNTGKYGPEKIPYLDTLPAVLHNSVTKKVQQICLNPIIKGRL